MGYVLVFGVYDRWLRFQGGPSHNEAGFSRQKILMKGTPLPKTPNGEFFIAPPQLRRGSGGGGYVEAWG